MKFKLDENLPTDIAELLQEAGYDAMTVLDQKLGGHADPRIASVCRTEDRALITLDMDFADIRTYPPNQYPGVVVLRLRRQDKPHVMATVAGLIPLFSAEVLERRLWIVEEDKLRIRE
jgi:predicted nuclease of predicted toxin-antitoxin system